MKVVLETDATTNPDNVGGVRFFSENDTGSITGTPDLFSTETDIDYRQRIAPDFYSDEDIQSYTAQNTNKYRYDNTTMAIAFEAGQARTNSASITTTTTGVLYQSREFFPTT